MIFGSYFGMSRNLNNFSDIITYLNLIMLRHTYILIILLTAVFFQITAKPADTFAANEGLEYHQADNYYSSIPANISLEIYGNHKQGRNLSHLIRIPAPYFNDDEQEFNPPGMYSEPGIRQAVSICLNTSKSILPGLSSAKLLFPFHTFL